MAAKPDTYLAFREVTLGQASEAISAGDFIQQVSQGIGGYALVYWTKGGVHNRAANDYHPGEPVRVLALVETSIYLEQAIQYMTANELLALKEYYDRESDMTKANWQHIAREIVARREAK